MYNRTLICMLCWLRSCVPYFIPVPLCHNPVLHGLCVPTDQMEFEAAQKIEAAQMNGTYDQSLGQWPWNQVWYKMSKQFFSLQNKLSKILSNTFSHCFVKTQKKGMKTLAILVRTTSHCTKLYLHYTYINAEFWPQTLLWPIFSTTHITKMEF